MSSRGTSRISLDRMASCASLPSRVVVSWRVLASPKVLRPVVAVGGPGTEGVANADRAIAAVHDVRAVAGAGHPLVHDGLRRRLAGGDVLTPRKSAGVAGIGHALVE